MTRVEARQAVVRTIDEANAWIVQNFGGAAEVVRFETPAPRPDFIPDSGGEEAWVVQLPVFGAGGGFDQYICIWVWAEPDDEEQFRTQYNLCG